MFKLAPLKIELEAKVDKYQQTLHFGKLACPATLRFAKGVVFMIFTSEPGAETLLIGSALPNKKSAPIKKDYDKDGILNRCFIPLDRKMDTSKPPAPYFMAVVKDEDLELDIEDGYVFFVFTAKSGSEQLQIVRNTSKFDPTVSYKKEVREELPEEELEEDDDLD